MARTPSMTAGEAAALIGPAGTPCTSDNRGLFKKWLVALGFPSDFVGGLSLIELQLAYKDERGLQKAREKLERSRAEDGPDATETAPAVTAAPANGTPALSEP